MINGGDLKLMDYFPENMHIQYHIHITEGYHNSVRIMTEMNGMAR